MLAFVIAAASVPLPLPLVDTERLIVVPVSAEVRSDTVKRLAAPPLEAARFTFHCEMNMRRGEPTRCIEAEGRYPKSWDEYRLQAQELSAKLTGTDANPLLSVAHSRVMQIRVVNDGPGSSGGTKIMTFSETVTPDDALFDPEPVETVEAKDIIFSQKPSAVDMANLYPAYALRLGVTARTTVTCRVNDDLTLSCRNADAKPNLNPDNPDYERMSNEFRLASYQLMSLMKASSQAGEGGSIVGKDFDYPMSWLIPR